MSANDLREAFKGIIPGSENLTVSYAANGNQIIHVGDKSIEVGAMASNDDIIAAIRNADRLPNVAFTAERQKAPSMSVTGASYVTGSIADKLKSVRAKIEAGSAKMDQAIAKMDQAATAHSQLADTVSGEADALLAELGQFTNSPPQG